MNPIPCPELCPDCPLAELVPEEPRQLVLSDRFIAKGIVNETRNSVSFDFENGRPVGPHFVEIALMPEVYGFGMGFWVDSKLCLHEVAQAFEDCRHPNRKRIAGLKLGRKACGALLSVAEEV